MDKQYDVFISYSRRDYEIEYKENGETIKKLIPNNLILQIVEALKKVGITCWYNQDGVSSASRTSMKQKIDSSRAMIFVSSAYSNKSRYTSSEIAYATSQKKQIIAFKIDNTEYNDDFALLLAPVQNIDAFPTNPEKALQELIKCVKESLKLTEEEKLLNEKGAITEERERKELEYRRNRVAAYPNITYLSRINTPPMLENNTQPPTAVGAGGTLLSMIGGLLWEWTEMAISTLMPLDGAISQDVYSSIFAPAEIKKNSHMLVQVYLHLYEETEKVKSMAQESDKNAERRDYTPLQSKLKKGDKVDVQLNIYGEKLVMSAKKSVVWHGAFTKCSFDYFVPKDIDVNELSCLTMLSVNGAPIGEMRFLTRIVEAPRQLNPEIISHKYNRVFISYAHKDEAQVKSFHEGLNIAGIEHFFDRTYLKIGDVFPQVIQDYINTADLFVLFWSKNAAESEYVRKERIQALKRAFPHVKPQQAATLSIYPMSIEPRADLPTDMKDYYHFGAL